MKCKICNRPKTEFYQYSDGREFSECKECTKKRNREWRQKNKQKASEYLDAWNKTVKGYRHRMWVGIKQRCGSSDGYKNVELRMTKEEWYEFATPLLTTFLEQNPNKTPSVDRIDPDGHYETKNLQIISWEKNLTTSRIFLQKLNVNKGSSKEEKLQALQHIMEGQCEALGFNYKDAIKELNG